MSRGVALALTALLLAGCGGQLSAKERLKDKTATMVEAANAHDPAALRAAAVDLRSEVIADQQGGVISSDRARTLLRYLSAIERDAGLLDATPTPSPTASATPSPTSSPTRSPTPSPTPSHTPSPTPSPTPSATASPLPSATLGVGLGNGNGNGNGNGQSASPTATPGH